LVVHRRSHLNSARHRRFPITSVAQTLLDFAAEARLLDVRRALAQADYCRLLDPDEVHAVLGQGRRGTATLRAAFERHEPTLARARSWLEVAFVPLCESAGIPLPEINVGVAGWTVDALWREERVVVELDGYDNHSTRAQMERDRRKELDLRAAGFLVIRYTRDQIVDQPEIVAADLIARLAERREQLERVALNSAAPSA
jgi:very-short-patch-repair endonuclease